MPNPPLALIVDNDAAVNALLQEVLRRRGFAVEAAFDGKAALARLESAGVDLLVCDLDMPGLDGHGVLKQLAQRDDAPPVLIVSGYVDPRHEATLRSYRCVRAVYEKPFDVLEFADACVKEIRAENMR